MSFTKWAELQTELSKTIMKEILPDNRPITGFQIVEELDKCPSGYVAIPRTHDSDSDADLWRASTGLFVRNAQARRYLCLKKSTKHDDYVVDKISVIGDKEQPMEGFTLVAKTSDSGQKAWRKKQICYRLVKPAHASQVITDVILCLANRTKRPPEGFASAGEINGVLICYKSRDASAPPEIPLRSPPVPPKPNLFKDQQTNGNNNDTNSKTFMHQGQPQSKPLRPAPTPPKPAPRLCHQIYSSNTLSTYSSLDGVPFVISSKIKNSPVLAPPIFNGVKLGPEYDYNFTLEYQILSVTK